MPFWSRDQLPLELRDRDPREIIEALNKLKELEEKSAGFDKTKSDLETQLNTHKTEAETMRQKLQELEANITNAQQQYQQQQPQPEPPNIWSDPATYINQATAPTQWIALSAHRGLAKMEFERDLEPRDSKIYQKYAKEVEQAMQGFKDPTQHIQKQNWRNAFMYVKGMHEQDIAKQESEGTPFFSEPASRGGGEPAMPQEDKLTDEEQEICRRFHWDPEGYLKRKKEGMVHQSERGAFARFPVPERIRK